MGREREREGEGERASGLLSTNSVGGRKKGNALANELSNEPLESPLCSFVPIDHRSVSLEGLVTGLVMIYVQIAPMRLV